MFETAIRFAAAVAAVAVLAACGQIPKPFQPPPDSGPARLAERDTGGGVRVAVIEGPSIPMARLLAQSVAADLVERGIPATAEGGEALRYTLKGRVEMLDAGKTEGLVARIHWNLTERGAQPFFTFSQDVKASPFDWQWGSPKVIREVGEAAGKLIAEAVEPEDETLKPVRPVTAGVWVQPIRGAPGDGDRSLTRAMRYALMGAKVAVTSEKMAARHLIDGKVRLGPVSKGRQKVEIRWTVTYPDGGTVGHAVQRNEVPAGTFDGRWGETASMIAAAAVGGIKDVLDRAEETVRLRLSTDRRLKTDVVAGPEQPVLPPPDLSPEPVLPKPPRARDSAPKG